MHIIKKNTEALLTGSKEIGLDVNVDKTKYMVMSRDQNAERSHNIKIDNGSFERVEQFKLLFRKKLGVDEVRKCLLSFGAKSFVAQFAIQRYKN